MSTGIKMLGRTFHPTLKSCVRVGLRAWEGPTEAGRSGRERWTEHLFPVDQRGRAANPRHPSGYNEVGIRTASVSPGSSVYSDLLRYGQFGWGAKAGLSQVAG